MAQEALDTKPYRLASGELASHTSLGSYPLVYLTADSSCLCAKCANSEGQTTDPSERSTFLVAADVHWEGDPEVCDACGAEIESAYGPVEG
jgi:hypothetical protein